MSNDCMASRSVTTVMPSPQPARLSGQPRQVRRLSVSQLAALYMAIFTLGGKYCTDRTRGFSTDGLPFPLPADVSVHNGPTSTRGAHSGRVSPTPRRHRHDENMVDRVPAPDSRPQLRRVDRFFQGPASIRNA